MLKLITTKSYERKLKSFQKKHPNLRNRYLSTLKLLSENPFAPSLRLHKLHGDLSSFYSVSLNFKYRIMITLQIQDDQIILVDIGSHDDIYRG